MPTDAHALPARYYTDPAVFRAEMEQFFFRMWIAAGRADQIPSAGDYVLRDVIGESVIVARGDDGRIRGTTACAGTAARGSAQAGRPLCRFDPVSVSLVDVRPRRLSRWRAAHGRGPALPAGRASAPSDPVRHVGWPRLSHAQRAGAPAGRAARGSAVRSSWAGGWKTCGSGTGSCTT